MRTTEQEKAFAKACAEREKRGEDVLDYIAREYPSYTPRAVWHRLQKECLKRAPTKITEGHPAQKAGRKEKKVEKEERGKRPRRNDTGELAAEVAKVAISGKDPLNYLSLLGYANAKSQWQKLKRVLQEERPELYEQIEPRKKPEKPENGGTVKPAPTCCQPAKKSGVTVPEKLPEDEPEREPEEKTRRVTYPIGGGPIEFGVKQLTSRTGVWERRGTDIAFSAHETGGKLLNVLVMEMDQWLNLAAEIPEAIKRLTLDELKMPEDEA